MSLARKVISECNLIAKAMGKRFHEEFDADELFENAQVTYTVAYDYLTESSVLGIGFLTHFPFSLRTRSEWTYITPFEMSP